MATIRSRGSFLLFSVAIMCVSPAKAEDGGRYVRCEDLWKSRPKFYRGFQVFCHKPKDLRLAVTRSLSSVYIDVKPTKDDQWPTFHYGQNVSDVLAKQAKSSSVWSMFIVETVWPTLSYRLPALEESCLGVDLESGYDVSCKYRAVDGLYLGLLVSGLAVFLCAPRFSRSVYFHYSSGVTIGILGSLLVIVYILSRFIPKKVGAGAFLLGGWAIVLAFLRQIFESFFTSEYRDYIAAYIVVAGVISFALCYWYGPVRNERTMHILEGALYLIGAALMFCGVQHRPTALAVVALLSVYKYCDRTGLLTSQLRWPSFHRFTLWKRRRYPKRRRLTMEEFDREGEENTREALEQLREYCNSPQCNPWRMIARMDTPDRFAKFVMGEDHVSDHELTLYESDMSIAPEDNTMGSSLLTSDSD